MDTLSSFHPRKCRRITTIQSISDLPDGVVDNILCFLPFRDAVRTSILSREWRNKWTTIPELRFDDDLVSRFFLQNNKMKVEDIINQVLLRHRGSINKFVFNIIDFRPRHEDVDQWILSLSKLRIKEFIFRHGKNVYVVPAPLFAFQQLRHLTLSFCVFNPPLGYKGLRQLVSLELSRATFEPATFGKFISQCLLLEKLTLFCCSKFDYLKINVPSLKYFRFFGKWTSICCRKSSNLAEVALSSEVGNISNQLNSTLDKVMCSLPTVQKLRLDYDMLEFFAGGYVPKKLSATLLHLKFLSLDVDFSKVLEVSCVLCLIRSCQNLQTLEIGFWFRNFANYEAVVELLQAQESPDCILNNLRKFVLVHRVGVEPEREFLKYILLSSPVLDEIDVRGGGGVNSRIMVEELKQFPRASPKITLRLCGKHELV